MKLPTVASMHETVGAVLSRCATIIIEDWLVRAKKITEISALRLRDAERTGHIPKLLDDLVVRLKARTPMNAVPSASAVSHGELRYLQGYTPPMLVDEARILEITLFETLHKNQSALDFRFLLSDVAIIADEVDSQLAQSVNRCMKVMRLSAGKMPAVS